MKKIDINACVADITQKEHELKEAKEKLNNELIELAKSILYPFANEIKSIEIKSWRVADRYCGGENPRYNLGIQIEWLNAPTVDDCDKHLKSIKKHYCKNNVPVLDEFSWSPRWVSLSTPSDGNFEFTIFPSMIDRFLYIQTTSESQLNQEID